MNKRIARKTLAKRYCTLSPSYRHAPTGHPWIERAKTRHLAAVQAIGCVPVSLGRKIWREAGSPRDFAEWRDEYVASYRQFGPPKVDPWTPCHYIGGERRFRARLIAFRRACG